MWTGIKTAIGLIPARAGTTQCPRYGVHLPWAHPRSRGDHLTSIVTRPRRKGSSPLARGPQRNEGENAVETGLIPARAGTTFELFVGGGGEGAHPRSRGDHKTAPTLAQLPPGSSPLARGPRLPSGSPCRGGGLIPARAGTTLADMGFYPLHQQNRITLKPEPKSRIHDKQQLLTTTSTAIPARLTPP